MHVYHFGAYEPTAFKRLSGRYATRETELDTILRAELFVDLHTIVRHSLRASVETYSLKDLEQFYGLAREQDLREATASRRALEWAIEMREDLGLHARRAARRRRPSRSSSSASTRAPDAQSNRFAEHIAIVERYNRDDCVSAARLRDWLEELRAAAERAHGDELPRPELHSGEASEQVAEAAEETQRVMAALLAGVPVDAAERNEEQQARWLMAQLLEWHRREEKAAWWEYFRLLDLPLEDYEDERSALAGLEFHETVGGTPRKPVHRYEFPPQEHDVRRGDEVCVPVTGKPLGKIVGLDVAAHTVDIEHTGRFADVRPERVFVRRMVSPKPKPSVLLEIGRWIAANGVDAPRPASRRARPVAEARAAARARLARARAELAPPQPQRTARHRARRGAQRARPAARGGRRAARERRRPRGPRSDPPRVRARPWRAADSRPAGHGQDLHGLAHDSRARESRKKVGVTAVGHETIRNVLRAVCEHAAEQGLADFQCLHKGKPKDDNPEALHAIDDNDRIAQLFATDAYRLLGGTSWLWANERFRDSVDVLFIDEAGQMSLADVLAVSAGAKSLVLLGDPQQLEQPQQASHPPGAAASALEHLLGGAKTIASDRGLFLHQTRRLHPDICAFTAEAFYERPPDVVRRASSGKPCWRRRARRPRRSAARGSSTCPSSTTPTSRARPRKSKRSRRSSRALTADGVRYRNAADEEAPLTNARSHDRRAVQRAGHGARGAAARRAHRHRRQVPGPAGAGRHRLADDVRARGRAARHGLSLQREPA